MKQFKKLQESPRADRLAPKKSLGQNFLTDKNIARKIVDALGIEQGNHCIEIGPGEGALTGMLLEQPATLTAIDMDERAIALLQEKFSDALHKRQFALRYGDFLKAEFSTLLPHDNGLVAHSTSEADATSELCIRVIGNIPYYITSDILFRIFEQSNMIHRAVIMMQKEVAERLVAKPRTKEYGILSVATALVAKARIVTHVAPQCFFPRPNVTSSVVQFDFFGASATATFRRVQPLVRMAFHQRRKVLANALGGLLTTLPYSIEDILLRAEVENIAVFRKRAEELVASDFIRLADFFQSLRNPS
jgi:16S rRNA (adenine1518-N6/adenine1519-N6)-dimethyltransferase